MENLNAEQVKKDLQNIVDNYSGSWTRFNILSNALALINSQEQRIKELTEENERLRNKVTATIILTDKDAERIKTECLEKIELDVKAIQADTVKEFAERLRKEAYPFPCAIGVEYAVPICKIDQVKKEMLEGEK